MKWLLKQILLLTLTLMVSTCAAALVKVVMRYGTRGPRVYVADSHPARGMRDAPVLIVYQPRLPRTDEAIRNGVTGTVELSMTLNWDGTVSDIKPVKTLPAGLTEQAMKAARHIRFRQAIVGGQFTDAEQLVEFQFDSAHDLAGFED